MGEGGAGLGDGPECHDPGGATTTRGNMLSLSGVESEGPELAVEEEEEVDVEEEEVVDVVEDADVFVEVEVDEDVKEEVKELRHESQTKVLSRKSFVMRAVMGEWFCWRRIPRRMNWGPMSPSKLASGEVGEGGIISSCRCGSGRRL